MPTVTDVLQRAEQLWPAAGAEDWDAVGLVVGDPSDEVRHVLLAVDPTVAVAEEAVALGADLLIVHHPLLLRGVTSVRADRPKGRIIRTLIGAGCALIAAHTNADVVDEGTSGAIARALGLHGAQPFAMNERGDGLGRVGDLSAPTSLRDLASRLAAALPATPQGVLLAGDPAAMVQRVSICGGAGDSFLEHPAVLDSDVYITADLRHHPALDATERHLLGAGPALLGVSHWASESLWLERAAEQLRAFLPEVHVSISTLNTDPWSLQIS